VQGLDSPINLDSPTREKIDLNGTWNVTFEGSGLIEKWTDRHLQEDVKVPSSVDFEGRMTFNRTFTIKESLRSEASFKFVALGINYECEVYINDVFIGRHKGGYSSFEFEIPDDALQVGQENTIRIMVENQPDAIATLPVRKQVMGWKSYGGILRDVYILATPRVWIDRLHLKTALNQQLNQATLTIKGVICANKEAARPIGSGAEEGKSRTYFIESELCERFSDQTIAKERQSEPLQLEPNKEESFQISIRVNDPKLWSPENPELFILKTSIIAVDGKQTTLLDQYNLNTGFSSFIIDRNSIILNGKKIVLKGVVWHEDSPKYGASVSYEQMEKDVVLIKSLGANAVRFAFHPPHPYMLNLCSRYGIMVLEELPVWNVPSDILNTESFASAAEAQAQEMIERDGHYPCVVSWGIGSQFDSADRQSGIFIRRISSLMRQLDSRPIYYGTSMLTNDACKADVDFVGIILPPVDLKNFRRLLSDWKKGNPSMPLVVLAYGKAVEQGNRDGYTDPVSEEAQARFFLQCYSAIRESEAAGSFINAITDWRGDRPLMTYGFGNYYVYPFGLMSQYREKRLAYDAVRSLFSEERVNIIPAGSHRTSFPWAHVVVGFFIILLIGYEYSTNRRFSENLRRSLLRSYNFFVDLRAQHTVSITHTLILSGAISVTLADLLSNVLYHYRNDRFADYIVTQLLVMDKLKEQFIHVTWHPLAGIFALACLFFVGGILVALVIKTFSIFIRARVTWLHAYSVSVWSAAPIIFLSVLAMMLFKLMENSSYVLPFFVLIFVFLFWTFLRVLKGISVVYELSRVKTYTAGILLCVFIIGGLIIYYDSVFALSAYIKMIGHLAQNPW
jgi:hypothetical protein